MNAATVDRRGDVLQVNGVLTIFNAARTLDASGSVFHEGGDRLVLDLAGLEDCDSAALAVLLEWMRRAKRTGQSLVYRNMPERLWQLARISELEGVLPIEGNA